MIRKHLHAGRSLDIGCGSGLLCRLLSEAGFDVYGADLSEKMVQRARALLADRLADAPQRFRVCPDGRIPYDPAKDRFDLITAIGVLQFVQERAAYLAHLAALLQPGGCLVLSNSNPRSLFVSLAVASRMLRFRPTPEWRTTIRNLARTGIWSGGHVVYERAEDIYSAAALDRLAGAAGLAPVDAVDFYYLGSRWLDRDPGRRSRPGRNLARRWGWNHVGLYRQAAPT